MSDTTPGEDARAGHEAVDATVHRTSRGPVARAVQAAMARYLGAEQYRQRPSRAGRPDERPDDDGPDA